MIVRYWLGSQGIASMIAYEKKISNCFLLLQQDKIAMAV
jgi:hypothetical protein